ncbi:MAG: EscU/YscU/HrcU family type III secretion system export apparatus switch protein [Lachnospiraceae bacterium]|nr:EscU/YscU/HrcU family type III secretion system export apparatus switch protein [Lachnospiraceae bacterium]
MAQTNEELRKKMAVALSYEPEEGAPKIVASGEGYVAQKIEETAKANDVPLYEDSKLAKTLLKLDIGECIPPELYSVVAEILVYVDDMDRLRSKVGHLGKRGN